MFVALQTNDHARVTSIAAQWDERLEVLRELTSSGQLICPGCSQTLWLRIGTERRRHFAHRHLADCPLGRESADVLEAKAQLFKWLETKYPDKVHLDMAIGVSGGSTLADLLVEAAPGRKFAYWVFDRQQRSRDDLLACQQLDGVHAHFIHTQSTLVSHSETDMALTASQRDFIGRSDFDDCIASGRCGHLLFLDTTISKISIYRGLRCVHAPNLYTWNVVREGLLAAALISPKAGEIVLADDVAVYKEWRLKVQQDKATGSTEPRNVQPRGGSPCVSGPIREEPLHTTSAGSQELTAPSLNLTGPFRCEDCGIETTDWVQAAPSTGTCVCRRCVNERWRQKTSGQPRT